MDGLLPIRRLWPNGKPVDGTEYCVLLRLGVRNPSFIYTQQVREIKAIIYFHYSHLLKLTV